MSERDYASEIDALAKRIEAIEAEAKRLNEVILDDVLHTLGDMKEVAAIERAATCGTGPNEPGVSSPAQADVGEAPAESEWPRYVQINETRIARFDGPLTESINLDNGIDHGSRGVFWREAGHYLNDGRWTMLPRAEAEARITAAKGEKPRLDDAFPIPATVEQGSTKSIWTVDSISYQLAAARQQLAARDAEIERLKEERDTEARCNAMSIEQLSAATAANVEREELLRDIWMYASNHYHKDWGGNLLQRLDAILAARDAAEGNG